MSQVLPEAEQPFHRLGMLTLGSTLPRESGRYLRFDLLVGVIAVPLLLWISPTHPEKLTVLANGAVGRQEGKAPEEVFQRRTWVEKIRSSCLFIADPTLNSENTLRIGWGQGSKLGYAIPAMSQAAHWVGSELGVDSVNRLYYGSNAGGFQAMQLAVRDAGAQALVNNPQTDWSRYIPAAVRRIVREVYGAEDVSEVIARWPGRVRVVDAFRELGRVPKLRMLVNAASENDITEQLPAFVNGLGSLGVWEAADHVEIELYHHEALGHMPLQQPRTLDEIHRALENGR